jgi:hypothetical protein
MSLQSRTSAEKDVSENRPHTQFRRGSFDNPSAARIFMVLSEDSKAFCRNRPRAFLIRLEE